MNRDLKEKLGVGVKKLATFGLLTLVVASSFGVLLAQDGANEEAKKSLTADYKSSVILQKLNDEIEKQKGELDELNGKVSDSEKKIEESREKINTLSGQLALLDEKIAISEELIANITEQISRKETEIYKLEEDLKLTKIELDKSKANFYDYLELIYRQKMSFGLDEDNEAVNTIKILLSNQDSTDLISKFTYSEILEQAGRNMFQELVTKREEYQKLQDLSYLKRQQLKNLLAKKDEEKKQLELERNAKQYLLDRTKGEERIYQELLELTKKQQEESVSDLESLYKNQVFIKAKLAEKGSIDLSTFEKLFEAGNEQNLADYLETLAGNNTEFQPRWPVSPSRGVSAYFREASYAKYFKMQHNAVDIRAKQATPIRAPADGIVFRAKDNGYGYSYIILAHAGDFMTVYGQRLHTFCT